MDISNTQFLTVEQAVARLINFDYIPEGFTLLEMTESFLDDADCTYENAKIDGVASEELERIACWANSCEARHALAISLMESLQKGIDSSESDLKLTKDKSTGDTLVSLENLNEWAAFRFGIQIPERAENSATSAEIAWEDVKIKIYAEYRIGLWLGNGNYKKSSFQDIGLMGKLKAEPNKLGGLLIGLSKGKKFPNGNSNSKADGVAICRLRDCLKTLTGLDKDPFTPFNKADGWKPRFTLEDDRGNAAKRAKRRAVHVPYKEELDYDSPDFHDEDDDAGAFLKGR